MTAASRPPDDTPPCQHTWVVDWHQHEPHGRICARCALREPAPLRYGDETAETHYLPPVAPDDTPDEAPRSQSGFTRTDPYFRRESQPPVAPDDTPTRLQQDWEAQAREYAVCIMELRADVSRLRETLDQSQRELVEAQGAQAIAAFPRVAELADALHKAEAEVSRLRSLLDNRVQMDVEHLQALGIWRDKAEAAEAEVSRLREALAEAMAVLQPNMPESGLVDACRQVKQVAVSEADNSTQLEAEVSRLQQEVERLKRELAQALTPIQSTQDTP